MDKRRHGCGLRLVRHGTSRVAGVILCVIVTNACAVATTAQGVTTAPAATRPASSPSVDLKRVEAAADAVAREQLSAGLAPGMTVAVGVGGQVVFCRGYGKADLELDVAAGPETVYRIGSITKQITAAAVMRLVDQGKLALDDPIEKFFPDYPAHGRRVTVRQLLNHTSGIKDYTELPGRHRWREFRLDLTYPEMAELFAGLPLDFEPGSRWLYNNSGYYLLGEIVARVTGLTYGQYVEREVMRPLGLVRTVYADDRRIIPNRARGYDRDGDQFANPRYVSSVIPGGAGGLGSTAPELVRWAHLLHGGKVVGAESLRRMTEPTKLPGGQVLENGFGLRMRFRAGRAAIEHGGIGYGFTGFLVHYPDDGVTTAVLANGRAADTKQVEEAVARAAFGTELRDLPVTAEAIARYEGAYVHQAGEATRELKVFGRDGQLWSQLPGSAGTRLRHQGEHVFVPVVDGNVRLVFEVRDGRAAGVTFHKGDRQLAWTRKP